MKTTSIRRLLPLALLLSALTAAPPAIAEGGNKSTSEQRAGRVTLEMPVVYATTQHSRIDPELKNLVRYLRNLRYTGYELIDTKRVVLAPKGSDSYTLVGNRKVRLDLLSKEEKRVRVRVQITGAKGMKLLDTTIWVNRNGTFIVAGPKHKNGVLVLPLTARY